MSIEEGLFGDSDGLLEFGRRVDSNQCQIGEFQGTQLHGLGKLIDPNQIIQQGYFERGYYIEDVSKYESLIDAQYLKNVNWNDYFHQDHHIRVMREAKNKET